MVLAAAVDDVLAVIVLRDIGENTGVYVAGDVLTADHEAEVFAGIECHTRWSQGDFDFHDFALRQFLVAVETLNGDVMSFTFAIILSVRK